MLRAWAAGAALVLLTSGAVLIAHGREGSEHDPAASKPMPSVSQVKPVINSHEVAQLERALSSRDPAVVASVMTDAVAKVYRTRRDAVLPAGSSVMLDAGAARRTGNVATVPIRISGPVGRRWLLLLVREEGEWRAYGTRALS